MGEERAIHAIWQGVDLKTVSRESLGEFSLVKVGHSQVYSKLFFFTFLRDFD